VLNEVILSWTADTGSRL